MSVNNIFDGSEAALHHGEIPFTKTAIASAVHSLLEPKTLLVEENHTIDFIERHFGIVGLGQSLLLGVRSLTGKTLQYHKGFVRVVESGTMLPVRAANDEQFAVAA